MNQNYDIDWQSSGKAYKGPNSSKYVSKPAFQKASSTGSYHSGYKNFEYKQKSNDGFRGKLPNQDSSSIRSVSELFHVLLRAGQEPESEQNAPLWRSSSEKNDNTLMQKLLDPSSISWSLFDDSEDEEFSDNEAESSENDVSDHSLDSENEEDFDENEISEQAHPSQSKTKNKDVYLTYLNSISSTPLNKVPEDSQQSKVIGKGSEGTQDHSQEKRK